MTAKRIIALMLLIATMVVFCLQLVGCNKDNEAKISSTQPTQSTPPINETYEEETALSGGMCVGEGSSYGIQLMSVTLDPAEYADYGISAMAETAVTISATVQPDTVENKDIIWSVAWTNPSSDWAIGNEVSEYVSFYPSGSSVSLSCIEAFGEQITVTAKSDNNPEIMATCVLEYAQKVTAASLFIGNIPVNIGGNTEIVYEISPSVTGNGGPISASVTRGDVYTLAEEFNMGVFIDSGSDYFKLDGHTITGMATGVNESTNMFGKSLYFGTI